MREKINSIIRILKCRINRHEYFVRVTFDRGCQMKTCLHCGRPAVAGKGETPVSLEDKRPVPAVLKVMTEE
ncbi:MAG: hypothetical protein P8013_06490 [Candidatus Sulfobium sp.]|jgi:hypothetical protein